MAELLTPGKIIKEDQERKILKLLQVNSGLERDKNMYWIFHSEIWNQYLSVIFILRALKCVNWQMELLLRIFSMYRVFCKYVVFLFCLCNESYVRDLNFAVGIWKTWEAALCQAISLRIHFTYCWINGLSGVVTCHGDDTRSIKWNQGMYSQQISAICLTLSNYIYFDTEHPLSV